jgi:hypothetical protein
MGYLSPHYGRLIFNKELDFGGKTYMQSIHMNYNSRHLCCIFGIGITIHVKLVTKPSYFSLAFLAMIDAQPSLYVAGYLTLATPN